LAAILFVIGLLAMVSAGALVALLCVFAAFGISRAIGWVISRFAAS
jgi:hypothetical protein